MPRFRITIETDYPIKNVTAGWNQSLSALAWKRKFKAALEETLSELENAIPGLPVYVDIELVDQRERVR